ncbi:hypothetical protein BGZ68_008887 [Mortierella alpina]|nr:hypothetical protein BGZ68_008887 [Mortierella alpina]
MNSTVIRDPGLGIHKSTNLCHSYLMQRHSINNIIANSNSNININNNNNNSYNINNNSSSNSNTLDHTKSMIKSTLTRRSSHNSLDRTTSMTKSSLTRRSSRLSDNPPTDFRIHNRPTTTTTHVDIKACSE